MGRYRNISEKSHFWKVEAVPAYMGMKSSVEMRNRYGQKDMCCESGIILPAPTKSAGHMERIFSFWNGRAETTDGEDLIQIIMYLREA